MSLLIGREVARFQTKDGKDAVIRYLSWNDIRAMQGFVNTVSKEDTYILLSGEQFSFENEADFIGKQLVELEKKNSVYLLCYIGDKLVGTFSASRNIHARKRERHVATLGLTVAKEMRSKGIGKSLMELGLKEIKKELQGIKLVTLAVFSNNSIGNKLYEGLGFKEYGRLPDGTKHGNTYVDHILMCKHIS